MTLNGLDVGTDPVLGDYEIWGYGREGTKWTITARSGGELLWVAGGLFSQFQRETERFTATVTSYAESDCTVEAYGESGLMLCAWYWRVPWNQPVVVSLMVTRVKVSIPPIPKPIFRRDRLQPKPTRRSTRCVNALLRGTIVNRTCGVHKNLYI